MGSPWGTQGVGRDGGGRRRAKRTIVCLGVAEGLDKVVTDREGDRLVGREGPVIARDVSKHVVTLADDAQGARRSDGEPDVGQKVFMHACARPDAWPSGFHGTGQILDNVWEFAPHFDCPRLLRQGGRAKSFGQGVRRGLFTL